MENKTCGINWFEIPVENMERAMKFYESIFGKKLDLQITGALEMAFFPKQGDPCFGAGGSLIKVEGIKPSSGGTLIYFPVEDIPPVLEAIKISGGKTLKPKTDIGAYGFIAHFQDSEGNRLGLHQCK